MTSHQTETAAQCQHINFWFSMEKKKPVCCRCGVTFNLPDGVTVVEHPSEIDTLRKDLQLALEALEKINDIACIMAADCRNAKYECMNQGHLVSHLHNDIAIGIHNLCDEPLTKLAHYLEAA